MNKPRIIDRGRGPEIEGTRITVYHVLEYLHAGRSRDYIAAVLHLSSAEVQTAIDYIGEHEEAVNAAYEQILNRIRQGNPAWVEERLAENRPRFEEFVAECRKDSHRVKDHAEDHVR